MMTEACERTLSAMSRVRIETKSKSPLDIHIAEGQVWRTRDGSLEILIVCVDRLRNDTDYPVIGVVSSQQQGDRRLQTLKIEVPRFTRRGYFILPGVSEISTHHPFDLVELVHDKL